jgi:tRNA pseudouridine55 synthase
MTAPFDHVTEDTIQKIIPKFIGKIMQIPPIFSAIRKDGKRLYEEARAGKTVDDIEIEPREVQIYGLEYIKHDHNGKELPCFGLNIECGGGTYIRSLVRDIGKSLDSVATMTSLERTQQGVFTISDAIPKEEWTVESIYNAIERFNKERDVMNDQKSLEFSNQVDEEAIEAV